MTDRLQHTIDARKPPSPLPEGFGWTRKPWGWTLICEPLAPNLHGWTTGASDFGASDEGDASVWQQLAAAAHTTRDRIIRPRQVHSARVTAAGRSAVSTDPADGAVTHDPSVLLTIRVADCVPLLIADTRSGAVAAVHAGWRGTSAAVARRAVEHLTESFGSHPADLVAAIGPSIGPCCYEVGAELRQAFQESGWSEPQLRRWFERYGERRLSLWQANRDQLIRAGLSESAVFLSSLCTACHPAWFPSYRREREQAGRIIGFIQATKRHP
jgi:YfiH family protein